MLTSFVSIDFDKERHIHTYMNVSNTVAVQYYSYILIAHAIIQHYTHTHTHHFYRIHVTVNPFVKCTSEQKKEGEETERKISYKVQLTQKVSK